jgi:hypothetical protein
MRVSNHFKQGLRAGGGITAGLACVALAPAAHALTLPVDVNVTTDRLPIGANVDLGVGSMAPAVSVEEVQPSVRTNTTTQVLHPGQACAADVQAGPSVQTPARASVATSRRASRSGRRSIAVPRRLLALQGVGACVRAS